MMSKNGRPPAATITKLKLRWVRKDGGPEETMEFDVGSSSPQELAQARAKLFNTFAQIGGFVKDFPDGTTELYPMALFEKIVIEPQSVVLAHPFVVPN